MSLGTIFNYTLKYSIDYNVQLNSKLYKKVIFHSCMIISNTYLYKTTKE